LQGQKMSVYILRFHLDYLRLFDVYIITD